MAESITILQARGRRLCKVIHAAGTMTAYDSARLFDLLARPVADLGALHHLLGALADQRDCAIVRGAIADPGRTRNVRRLLRDDPATGDRATLREVPRAWISLDCDSVPLVAGSDPTDLAECARQAIALLPDAFRDAACIAQATASHGIKPGARLRLWYWLARPLSGSECKAWLATAPVDPSIFGAATLIYTARPLFASGAHDHLPQRMATMPGRPVVTPPPAAALAPPPRPTPAAWPPTSGAEVRRLAGLIRRVATTPEGERHRALFWAACRAGEMVAAGHATPAGAAGALVQAAMAAGGQDQRRAEATARDGIARGMSEGARNV
jgi:hypothetical protein